MAKPNQVPESSMEEILASIRKIISEDESKPVAPRPRIAPAPDPEPVASNVSRLFADDPIEAERVDLRGTVALDEPVAESEPAEAVTDELEVAVSRRYPELDRAVEESVALRQPVAEWEPARPQPSPAASILSPRADAAVASAFNHLASTVLTANSRTIEQVAEDMMRPMLKEWLDDNLPPLVERLVREEIDRVSRRR